MFFQHIYDKSLAQASYLIGCQKTGEALVIDPKRDIDTYLDVANQNGLRITHVTETHIHADFLSGSRELAAATGAALLLSDEGGPDWQYEFTHTGLRDHDQIRVGNLVLEVLHTPGHTPESISFLLTDLPASLAPVILFTGDFVFVGDVGRPDLLEKAAGVAGTQETGARQLFASLQKFSALPDFVQVWPGHGAGSACGKALGAVPSTTIGYEKIRNWAFQHERDPSGFISYLLNDQPEPPTYFTMMKRLNKTGRPLLIDVPTPKKLSFNDVNQALATGIKLIDTRSKTAFAQRFLPGSINIQATNTFATWMGWFVDYQKPFMLVAADEQIEELTRQLMRIGMDNLYGYITGETLLSDANQHADWQRADVIDLATFDAHVRRSDAQLIDLRSAAEYKKGHIDGAENLFIGTLPRQLDRVSRDRPVVIYCQGGDRAAIGYTLLRRAGFTNIRNFSAGMNGWVNAGNPVVDVSTEAVF